MNIDLSKIRNGALMVYLFSLNYEVFDPFQTGGMFSVSKLTGMIYLASILPRAVWFVSGQGLGSLLRPVWIFFFLLLLSSIIHVNALFSNVFHTTVFLNIVIFWFMINHERAEPGILRKGLLAFAIGAIVVSLLYHAGIGISYDQNRLTLFGDNQNSVGMRMCVSMIILGASTMEKDSPLGRLRYLALLPLPVMLLLMGVTQSRVSLATFGLAFVFGVLLVPTSRWSLKILIIGIGIALAFVIWGQILLIEGVSERILQSVLEGDLSGRQDIWEAILPVIRENPVLGIGWTGYNYFTQSIFGIVKSPHNVILEVLCYTGFLGLSFYLLFFWRIGIYSIRLYRKQRDMLPMLLMLPVLGLLLTGQLIDVKLGWMIFAFIAGTYLEGRDPEIQPSEA